MSRSNKRLTKPKVSAKGRRRKLHAKLGYGQINKNINTLRKLEKLNQEEDILKYTNQELIDARIKIDTKELIIKIKFKRLKNIPNLFKYLYTERKKFKQTLILDCTILKSGNSES